MLLTGDVHRNKAYYVLVFNQLRQNQPGTNSIPGRDDSTAGSAGGSSGQ